MKGSICKLIYVLFYLPETRAAAKREVEAEKICRISRVQDYLNSKDLRGKQYNGSFNFVTFHEWECLFSFSNTVNGTRYESIGRCIRQRQSIGEKGYLAATHKCTGNAATAASTSLYNPWWGILLVIVHVKKSPNIRPIKNN